MRSANEMFHTGRLLKWDVSRWQKIYFTFLSAFHPLLKWDFSHWQNIYFTFLSEKQQIIEMRCFTLAENIFYISQWETAHYWNERDGSHWQKIYSTFLSEKQQIIEMRCYTLAENIFYISKWETANYWNLPSPLKILENYFSFKINFWQCGCTLWSTPGNMYYCQLYVHWCLQITSQNKTAN